MDAPSTSDHLTKRGSDLRRSTKKYEMDLCTGPLLPKVLMFSFPVALSGLLQRLFNTVDTIVAGKCVGSQALAAVGSVGSVCSILIFLFMGISMGVNVLVARYFGAAKEAEVDETVHTSMLLSVLSGIFLTVVGVTCSRPLLQLMNTPADIMELSVTYMRIYFLGVPGMLVYNAGAAVLRGVGDTRRPLYFLLTAGMFNTAMNLLFVMVFRIGVAGLALATALSQYLSAALVLHCLIRSDSCYRFVFRKLRIVPAQMREIARVGVPSGVEGILFDVGNVLFQASLNSFGSYAIAGSVAASGVEGYAYVIMNCFYQTALSFVSQNYGAGQYRRIRKVTLICGGLAALTGFVLGNGVYLSRELFLRIFTDDPEAIRFALLRMAIIGPTYFICGLQEITRASLRGLNRSVSTTVLAIFGILGVRLVWILAVFPHFRDFQVLLLCYPISYLVIFVINLVYLSHIFRHLPEDAPLAVVSQA